MAYWEQFWDESMTDTNGAEEDLADKLYRESLYFNRENQINDAVRVCDEIIDAFSGTKNPKIKILVAKALFDKGYYLGERMNSYQKAIPAFDVLINTYKYENTDEFIAQVVKGMFYKGYGLGKIKAYKQGILEFELLESKYKNVQDEEVQFYLARALLNKGILLRRIYKMWRSISTFSDLIDTYKNNNSLKIKELVKKANDSKSTALMIAGGVIAAVITGIAALFFKTNLLKCIFVFAAVYCTSLFIIFVAELVQKRSKKTW